MVKECSPWVELLTGWKPRSGIPSIPWQNSIQLQGNTVKLSSRSSKWIFLRNFQFQPLSQDWQFGVLIHSKRYGSQLWFMSQLPNLTHTGVGWKIPTSTSEEHDFTSSHVWIQWSARKNRCFPAPRWKKTTPSNLHQLWIRNESLLPTIASLPKTPPKVPDKSLTVRKSATISTPMEPLRRSTRITKYVPRKWLIINWCNGTNQLLCIYQCEIGS